jgi:uncharacterized protein YdhG (YjbR/CyaY superfamily)
MGEQPRYTSIDAYIAEAAPEAQGILQEIRRVVKTAVPDASETISYGVPAFKQKRVFIYFAAFKKHIGVYPPVQGDEALQAALRPYRGGEKGNLKFPLNQPIPYDLIYRVAEALAQAY